MKIKGFLVGFLSGALVVGTVGVSAAAIYNAKPVDFKVMVNGKEFTSNPPVLEVDGSTYLPLRAIGEALNIPVKWNEELGQVEIGNIAKIAEEASRENPVPLNQVVFGTVKKYSGEHSIALRVMESYRGDKAWNMIYEANQFNDRPPVGYEYIVAKIAFSLLDSTTDTSLSLSAYDFKCFSSGNVEMTKPSIVEPNPELNAQLYKGGNTSGYLVFQVLKDDPAPKIVCGLSYNGKDGIWLSLQ